MISQPLQETAVPVRQWMGELCEAKLTAFVYGERAEGNRGFPP